MEAINDREYIVKIRIRTDSLTTAQNMVLIAQEIFDDISDKGDNIDCSIKENIIHILFKE